MKHFIIKTYEEYDRSWMLIGTLVVKSDMTSSDIQSDLKKSFKDSGSDMRFDVEEVEVLEIMEINRV